MEKILEWNALLDFNLYFRGVFITLYAILLFRASSNKLYGNHSPLDFIIYIIIGAILGEVIVNNKPLLSSMIVCAIIVGIHHLLSYLCYKSHWLGSYIKGKKICIIKNGKYIEKNLQSSRITIHDISQALRVQHGLKKISIIQEAMLERDGQISFVLKNNK